MGWWNSCGRDRGAAAGAISTGTLKGAIIGAVGAAVTYGIGHELFTGLDKAAQIGARAVSHGVAQGTIAEISGGDFKDGFVGAAFSYVVGATVLDKLVPANDNDFGMIVARGAAEAVVGGTAAAIGGGKFANGAYSAAFVYAFNQVLQSYKGKATFGNNPRRSGTVIGTDRVGGIDQAKIDLDYLAELNGVVPPVNVPVQDLPAAGWVPFQGGTQVGIRNIYTGIVGRSDGTMYRIEMPVGIKIALGVVNETGFREVVHYPPGMTR